MNSQLMENPAESLGGKSAELVDRSWPKIFKLPWVLI